jgi:crotonobetainyl-CoA:carnitine CoA-transferase CaiB-like acyl-CoA transferase
VTGSLDGVLVADFSRVLAGPYATMLLADLGADVVKVESPDGDDTRRWGPPFAGGEATYFLSVNRNKRSVRLDLRDPGDAGLARELATRADVLVQNFRVGSLQRYGLDFEQVRETNPGCVYCTISGFGSGTGAGLPGYDLLVQAMGGLMSITGDAEPTKVGVAVVDILAGLHATVGILAALRHRDATGDGQHVQVDLLHSLLSGIVNQAAGYVAGGVVPGRLGNRHPSIVPYAPYPTADRPLVLAVGNDRQFGALCVALGAPELATDPRFAGNPDRVTHRAELNARLTELLAGRTAADWTALLTPLGVPCGPVNDVAGAFALATGLGLAPTAELPRDDGSAVPTVTNPIGLSATPPTHRTAPPSLGEHDAEIRAWLASDR